MKQMARVETKAVLWVNVYGDHTMMVYGSECWDAEHNMI